MSLSHEIHRSTTSLTCCEDDRRLYAVTGSAKINFVSGGDDDHTNRSTSKAGIPAANICSTSLFQRGRWSWQRRTYNNEEHKDYLIVNECYKVSAALYVLHDFFLDQAYSIFRGDELCEGQRRRYDLLHPPGSTGSRRIRRWWPPTHNTSRNSLLGAARATKIDSHRQYVSRITGLGEVVREPNKRSEPTNHECLE